MQFDSSSVLRDNRRVENAVLDALSDVQSVDRSTLSAGTDLVRDLGLESLDAIELVTKIEFLLGVELTLDAKELAGGMTVGDLVRLTADQLTSGADRTEPTGAVPGVNDESAD